MSLLLFVCTDVIKVLKDGDLQTLGMIDYDKKLTHSFTAHPKVDPVTGKSSIFLWETRATLSVDPWWPVSVQVKCLHLAIRICHHISYTEWSQKMVLCKTLSQLLYLSQLWCMILQLPRITLSSWIFLCTSGQRYSFNLKITPTRNFCFPYSLVEMVRKRRWSL